MARVAVALRALCPVALHGAVEEVAAEEAAATAAHVEAHAAEAAESAEAAEELRDPFWPVGYLPEPELPPDSVVTNDVPVARADLPPPPPKIVADWPAARKLLNVTGYAERGGTKSSLINGQIYQRGDLIVIIHQSVRYRWRLVKAARDMEDLELEEVDFTEVKK